MCIRDRSNSDGNVYVDNLSISKIQYYDNTGFYCDDREISSLAEMTGTVITAKTAVITPEENQQYMAVYDKATNQLKKIVAGVYDDRTVSYTHLDVYKRQVQAAVSRNYHCH